METITTFGRSTKHWYLPLLIGLFYVLVGVYVVTRPLAAYGALVILFSISFLVSGILKIWFSTANRNILKGWGWHLAGGLLSVLLGILLLANPDLTAAVLPIFVGFGLLFHAMYALGFAIELRSNGVLQWGNLAIFGVLGIVFSMILLFNPLLAGISIIFMTAAAFFFTGIASIVMAFQLRKLKKKLRSEEV